MSRKLQSIPGIEFPMKSMSMLHLTTTKALKEIFHEK